MSSHRSHPAWPGLPGVVKSRILAVGDLDMHIFECGPTTSINSSTEKPPLILLLHGFPELAYSWRKVILPLAEAGYYVVAPDQRGYGLTRPRSTTGSRDPGQVLRPRSKVVYTDDIRPYHFLNLSADIVTLIGELGYEKAEAVIGHDFGSLVTGVFALSRPDLVERVVLMSAPYGGPTPLSPSVWVPSTKEESTTYKLDEYLKKSNPPRQHYRVYHSSPGCNNDMLYPIEGLAAFLRNYYHVKSADWEGNAHPAPHPLTVDTPSITRGDSAREEILEATARTLEILPYYYVMPAQTSMPDALRTYAPSAEQVANNKWLSEEELYVYVDLFRENGFQGGLNWYRAMIDETWNEKEAGMRVMRGKKIEVPVRFLAGENDWGVWQTPGSLDAMKSTIKGGMKDEDVVTVKGAGHWVQQEQPEAVIQALLGFLKR